MKIALNDDELRLLLVASLEAGRLYVLGIRPAMDFDTGLAGVSTPIALGRLGIEVQYLPPQGSQRRPWKVDREGVRTLIEELIRVGLVGRYEAPALAAEKRLVLRCLVADRAYCGQKHEAHMKPTPRSRDDIHSKAAINQGIAAGESSMSHTPTGGYEAHISGDPVKPLSLSSSHPDSSVSLVENGDESGASRDLSELPHLPASGEDVGQVLQCLGWKRKQYMTSTLLPRLAALAKAGVSKSELIEASGIALANHAKHPSYAVTVAERLVESRLAQAASPRSAGGVAVLPLRRSGQPWFMSWSGIVAKGEELGLVRGNDEHPPAYKLRVLQSAGVSADLLRQAEVDAQLRR